MKKNLVITVCLSLLVLGCSSLNSMNQTTDSMLALKGGKSKNMTWNDALNFKRYSWFEGVSMKYDLLVAKLDRNSAFYNWLGRSEKSQVKDCHDFYIVLSYASLGNHNAKMSELMGNFDIVGLKRMSLPIWSSALKNHYFYLQWNLKRHEIKGYCKDNALDSIDINIPNYSPVRIFE